MPVKIKSLGLRPAHLRHPLKLVVLLLIVTIHMGFLWVLQISLSTRVTQTPLTSELTIDLQVPEILPIKSDGKNNSVSVSNSSNYQKPPAPLSAPANSVSAKEGSGESTSKPVAASQEHSTNVTSPTPLMQENTTGLSLSGTSHTQNKLSSAIEPPSSKADYLNNPKPRYPPASLRLEEQGRVVVHVLIGADGVPQKLEVGISSGFARLDRAALEAVKEWRFVPGKRAGVAEGMWLDVPLVFKIN